jgi:NTP pyrophosphatase (non-canonical NTP hydrolase)
MDFKEITNKIENFGKEYASYWGCALAGEVGEACNLIKKMERDNLEIKDNLKEELADIFIYTELLAQYFGIDLEKEILKKLEVIEKRRKDSGA